MIRITPCQRRFSGIALLLIALTGLCSTSLFKASEVVISATKTARIKEKLEDTIQINACGFIYLPSPAWPSSFKNPDSVNLKIVGDILDATGMKLNNENRNFFLAQSSAVKNAVAISKPEINKDKCLFIFRYVFYNPTFLATINAQTSGAGSYVVLAHEVAHHLNGDNFKPNSTPESRRQNELNADRFSGYLCFLLGKTRKLDIVDCIKAYDLIADVESTDTHPNKTLRIQNFQAGWEISKAYLDMNCAALNDLNTDPNAAISSISKYNKNLVSRIKLQALKSITPTASELFQLSALSRNHLVQKSIITLRGDTTSYLLDAKAKNLVPLATFWQYAKSGNKQEEKIEYTMSTVKPWNWGTETSYDQLAIDDKDIIWARFPNGVPYIAGIVKKIK